MKRFAALKEKLSKVLNDPKAGDLPPKVKTPAEKALTALQELETEIKACIDHVPPSLQKRDLSAYNKAATNAQRIAAQLAKIDG